VRPRFHARFPGELCEGLPGLGSDARLAAYRVEPVRTVDGPQHYLDLTFADGERIAVVAGIRIDRHALAHRDRSPFVAPREAAEVVGQLEAACDLIEPELTAMFAACAEPGEMLHVFADVAEEEMFARCDANALGAVPYASAARAQGRAVDDGAYVETCFAGDLPPAAAPPVPAFGDAAAPLRCYVALSDAGLASGDAAFRTALAAGAALGCDEVRVDVAGYDGRPLEPYAFVHVVGLDDPHAVVELLAAARAHGIRTLLTPLFDDASNGGYWGARTHARTLALGDDEEVLGLYLGAVVARENAFPSSAPCATPWEPYPGFRAAQRAALADADVVFVASASEGKRIRALGVERVFAAYVPAPYDVPASASGVTPYVLAVSPVGPLHASATLARAAARAGLPVRFTGAIVDGAYAARARSYLDDRSSFAPGDPGCGARVVVDISWTGADLSALAAHAARGVPIVGSNRAAVREVFGSAGVWEVDPADEVAIAAALCDAWNGAAEHGATLSRHVRTRCSVDVLQACLVNAYAPPEQVA
jgi:glycosyltransferase involved in cell wall biosynthesis